MAAQPHTVEAEARLPPMRYLSASPPHYRPQPHHIHTNSGGHSRNDSAGGGGRGDDEQSVSLSDEDMLLCDDDDDDDDAKRSASGRSRRLLSLEQSKMLYKILEKTHFPSTQLREAAASQLGVSPRKVQVWFQNRRQVGKKRMIEAIQTLPLPVGGPSGTVSLEVLASALKSTGKGRFSPNEDERTRAWRKHTIRLALNPSASEEEESKAAIAELERQSQGHHAQQQFQMQGQGRWYVHPPPHPHQQLQYQAQPQHYHQHQLQRDQQQREERRELVQGEEGGGCPRGYAYEVDSVSRRGVGLRIDVPRVGGVGLAAKTPTYTGPGSASHLETLSALSRGLPPLTPAVRTNIIPPAIVSSQKESFTLQHHHQQQSQSQWARHRSATVTTTPTPTTGTAYSGLRGDAMREVRGSLTADWSARQRAYELSSAGGMQGRYRSSTDAISRLAPIERYAPYPHPTLRSRPILSPSLQPAGRSRSISSPHHDTPNWRRQPHPSHASSSTAATSPGERWTSSSGTPTTATTATAGVEAGQSTGKDEKAERDGKGEREERQRKWRPMDVRSLTTSNLANTSAIGPSTA